MNAQLVVNDLHIAYDELTVVNNISFTLQQGEIGCLLGSSGCGKTTILRAIAGFERARGGTISLNGNQVSSIHQHLPPERREVGMVFQEHALFPHLTVAQNVGFGLKRHSSKTKRERVKELLELIGLPQHYDSYPHQLSGGQQQRIALIRALAPRPSILLLDEPFSNLDGQLRAALANELRSIFKKEQTTALLVTHDQNEAFAMADQIGIIEMGALVQWDSGFNLYHTPASRYVAEFIGEGVLLPARVDSDGGLQTELGKGISAKKELPKNMALDVLIRPDDVLLDPQSPHMAEVSARLFRGAEYLYTLTLPSCHHVFSLQPSHNRFEVGEKIPIRLCSDPLPAFMHR